MRGAFADDVSKTQNDGAQSERGTERGDERFGGNFASAVKTDGQARAEIFVSHSRADVAINRAGAGKDDLRHGIAAHGFEDVVGGDGFLLQVEPRVFNPPARVGICGEMKNPVNALEARLDFF